MTVLDTDICIWLLRGGKPHLERRLAEIDPAELAISSLTLAELRYGALRSKNSRHNISLVDRFAAELALLDFDDQASAHFAAIKAHLAARGELIGPMDLLIAAVSRSNDATFVTGNIKEFDRVPGLQVENWL